SASSTTCVSGATASRRTRRLPSIRRCIRSTRPYTPMIRTSGRRRRAMKHDIQRYTAGERSNHWIVAILFILAGLSGLALFHPAFYWLSNLFGGGVWTRILHPFIGVLMVVCFFVLAIRLFRYNLFTRRDAEWLRHIGDVLANREDNVPDAGRYNAGQKLLFFALILLVLGLLLTGLVMWRAYFPGFFPIWGIRLASL